MCLLIPYNNQAIGADEARWPDSVASSSYLFHPLTALQAQGAQHTAKASMKLGNMEQYCGSPTCYHTTNSHVMTCAKL